MRHQFASITILAAALAATTLTGCQSGGQDTTASGTTAKSTAATSDSSPSSGPTSTSAPSSTAAKPSVSSSPVVSLTSAPGKPSSTSTAPGGVSDATRVVVIRPVTAAGLPAPGYTAKVESDLGTMPMNCDTVGSPAAVSNGITQCGASAAYLPVCWKSTNNTALCLRYATDKVLIRITYSGAWGAPKKPSRPSPLGMTLADGDRCQIRIGGAWGYVPSHPGWVGFASCDKGADVYGPPNGDGINRANPSWSVSLYNGSTRKVTTQQVSVAYEVGTAA